MTDQRLREAQRRLHQEASIENEAAYLRARIAAGTLPLIRLQAAARLDYPPALMALDGSAPPSLEECLVRMGKQAVLRWGAAIARAALPLWEQTHSDPRPRSALAIVDRWTALEAGPERDQARSAAQEQCVQLANVAHAVALGPNEDEGWVFRAVVALLMVVWDSNRNLAAAFQQAMLVAAGVPEPNMLLQRASREFVPWLLGDRLYCIVEESGP